MIDYQSILEQGGYPKDILVLDFETFFSDEYSIEETSTIEYINDPWFEFTGLGAGTNEQLMFLEPEFIETYLRSVPLDHYTVLVQNARFDITILQTKFGIIPKYIIDLKDLAKHYDARMSHKLKDMAKLFGLKPKGETQNFKGLHWATMTPEQRQALKEYTITDVELETELAKILLPKLTCPREELALARHTLDLWLHQSFNFDTEVAIKLRVQMRAKIARAIQDSGHTPKELRSNKFIKYLADVLPAGEQVPMKKAKKTKKNKQDRSIPALAKTDEACQQLMVHPKKEVRDLITARLAVRSWPAHVLRISTMIAQTKANGGALRVALNYYGGHTGRWSGGEGYNLQNNASEGRSGQENDLLMQQIHTLIIPPDGYVVCTVDSAQIEARILAWLAGQQDLLDGFANNEDVYSQFITPVFQHPVRKPRKTDPPQLYIMLKIRRGFGKDTVLGAGYGMGAERFYQNCLKNPALRPFFDSGQYDFVFVKKLITAYRTTYSKIPEYWTKVEQAFRQALRFEHLTPEVGKVKFWCKDGTVHIQLPSGRVLYYRYAKIDKKNSLKYLHGPLWGGTICENIDQAIARDLLGYWILECEKAGIPIVLHIHDDTRTILPKGQAEEIAERQAMIMRTVPVWAEGLPVDTEIKISETL